ncbi:hypothetical protein L596_019309 [Steinernema carpocapsae]|nr:hypothetical protein L596_019309 [Steinernema carpocapsae]
MELHCYLGIGLVSNSKRQMLISKIVPGGAAERSRKLSPRDRILKVNDEEVDVYNYAKIKDQIADVATKHGVLTFTVVKRRLAPSSPPKISGLNQEKLVIKQISHLGSKMKKRVGNLISKAKRMF